MVWKVPHTVITQMKQRAHDSKFRVETTNERNVTIWSSRLTICNRVNIARRMADTEQYQHGSSPSCRRRFSWELSHRSVSFCTYDNVTFDEVLMFPH